MAIQHQELAAGRWSTLSLAEQLGNVGSEVSRARAVQGNAQRFSSAIARALELLDLTIADPRWRTRLKEILRAREAIGDASLGGKEYGITVEDLDRYFYYFALAARAHR